MPALHVTTRFMALMRVILERHFDPIIKRRSPLPNRCTLEQDERAGLPLHQRQNHHVDTTKPRESAELDAFKEVWNRGYFEGDPLDVMGPSGYRVQGYMSVLHAVYLACIRPYTHPSTHVLEIGPGRGGWSKAFVEHHAAKVWCLDAKPADANRFWEYVGRRDNVEYVQVQDFTLSPVPDRSIDLFFSFGCFCHISPTLIEEYIISLAGKMKPGANGFLMIADYEKFNRALDNIDRLSLTRVIESRALTGKRYRIFRAFVRLYLKWFPLEQFQKRSVDEPDTPRPGRWYHLGLDRACALLEREGFSIVQRDMDLLARDPMIHFQKS